MYGVLVSEPGVLPQVYAIEKKWQSSLLQSGQCGAFVGVFLAGPITNILGYRWTTTLLGLVLMNATIFISFFVSISKAIESTTKPTKQSQANSLEVLVIGQAFEGIPWISSSPMLQLMPAKSSHSPLQCVHSYAAD
jgi:SP family general alpha glucoside:H+ symporter-like MFS transporter